MDINITAIALIVTSFATVVYATLTYFLLKETRREKKKPIIEEILGVVLYPLKYLLEDEIVDLKKGDARLFFKKGKINTNIKINHHFSWGAPNLVYEDFKKIHINIVRLIDKHDELINELELKANALAKILYTTDFKKKCRDLIEDWDTEAKENQKLSNAYTGDSLSENILTFIINNIKELDERHVFHYFWGKKHNIFFEEKLQLAGSQSDDLKNLLKKISDFSENLLLDINKLIEKYQKKFAISSKHVTDKYEIFKYHSNF